MALKVDVNSPEVSSQIKAHAEVSSNHGAKGTRLLQLAMYKRYNRAGTHFEAEVIYRFSDEQAAELLDETDSGRPVWKVYRKDKPKAEQRRMVKLDKDGAVDLSTKELSGPISGVPDSEDKKAPLRIDIGDDDEIAEIVKDSADDVTI